MFPFGPEQHTYIDLDLTYISHVTEPEAKLHYPAFMHTQAQMEGSSRRDPALGRFPAHHFPPFYPPCSSSVLFEFIWCRSGVLSQVFASDRAPGGGTGLSILRPPPFALQGDQGVVWAGLSGAVLPR